MSGPLDMWRVSVSRLRQTPAGVDQYGDPIPGEWVETELPAALYAPGGTVEPVQPGVAAVISTPTVYWPGQDVDVTASDQLTVGGTTWHVEGRPAHWPMGTAVTLKTTEERG